MTVFGFRRDAGFSPSTGKPYVITASLRKVYTDYVLSYDEQVSCLVRHGFGLWDIVGSCNRPGSLDKDIDPKTAQPNKIHELAAANPPLKRIVITNGGKAADIFKHHFWDWCQSGELQAIDNEISQ